MKKYLFGLVALLLPTSAVLPLSPVGRGSCLPAVQGQHCQSPLGDCYAGGAPDLPVLLPHIQGTLVDLQAQRAIAFDTLVEAVAQADVVAVGEEHEHPDIQAFALCLLQALARRRPQRLALAMEFLEQHEQPAVDDYLAGSIDHHTFTTRVSVTPAFMRLYFPLVHYARQQGLPVVAMNVPRYIARQVAREGLEQTLQQLSPQERAYLPETLSTATPGYRAYFLAAVAAAHPLQGEQEERFVEAAYLKDETMAAALAAFLDQHRGFTVLAIAGRFHFDYGLAIPALLRQRRPQVVMPRITTMVVRDNDLVNLLRLTRAEIADYLRFFAPFPQTAVNSEAGVSPCTGEDQTKGH